jgi:hypothetical protein
MHCGMQQGIPKDVGYTLISAVCKSFRRIHIAIYIDYTHVVLPMMQWSSVDEHLTLAYQSTVDQQICPYHSINEHTLSTATDIASALPYPLFRVLLRSHVRVRRAVAARRKFTEERTELIYSM